MVILNRQISFWIALMIILLTACEIPGTDIGKTPAEKQTEEIIEAVRKGDLQRVKQMKNVDVNLGSSKTGQLPIIEAIKRKDIEMIDLLIQKGAKLEVFSTDGLTPLMIAVQQEDLDVMNKLISYRVNLETREGKNRTVIFYAAEAKDEVILSTLIKAGAKVNVEDYDGITPLMVAVDGNRSVQRIDQLVTAGADVKKIDTNQESAMDLAIRQDDVEKVSALLSHGFDPNAKNKRGNPYFIEVVSSKKWSMIEAFIHAKVDVNLIGKYGRKSPLMYAVEENSPMIVTLLLKHQADLNQQDQYGKTALMIAAEKGAKSGLAILIKHKPEINLEDKYGETALQKAKQAGNTEIVDILIKAGAK